MRGAGQALAQASSFPEHGGLPAVTWCAMRQVWGVLVRWFSSLLLCVHPWRSVVERPPKIVGRASLLGHLKLGAGVERPHIPFISSRPALTLPKSAARAYSAARLCPRWRALLLHPRSCWQSTTQIRLCCFLFRAAALAHVLGHARCSGLLALGSSLLGERSGCQLLPRCSPPPIDCPSSSLTATGLCVADDVGLDVRAACITSLSCCTHTGCEPTRCSVRQIRAC